MSRILAAVGLALVLGGCAKLEVTVDALSYSDLQDQIFEQDVRRDFERIVAQSDTDFKADVATNRAQAVGALKEAITKVVGAANMKPGRQPFDFFTDSSKVLNKAFDDYLVESAVRGTLRSKARQYRADMVSGEGRGDVIELVEEVRHADRRLTDALRDVLIDGKINAPSAPPTDAAAKVKVEVAAEAEAKRVINPVGGPTLVGSGLAALVAKAPETAWSTRVNRAKGQGRMGSSDIVIRMNAQGDFSVKGMSFDPSTVAAAAQKAGVQAVLMAAAISGVPINPANVTESERVGLASVEASTAAVDAEELQAKIEEREATARALAQMIIAEAASVGKVGSATKAESDTAIKASADSLLPQLGSTGGN